MTVTTRVVLLVDDDAAVRAIAAAALRESGLEVIEAADGLEGFVQFEAHPEIGLILTDVVMPGIDGFKVAEIAKLLRPTVKVLYVTAYPGQADEYLGIRHGEILMKPYRLAALVAAVRRTLAPSADAPCPAGPGADATPPLADSRIKY